MGFRARLVLALTFLLLPPTSALADDAAGDPPRAGEASGAPSPPPTLPHVAPVAIKIPALAVEADIVPVGLDDDGAMTAPSDPDTVAWYEPGPGTGVPGNVVLAGHVNWGGRPRVFGLLHRLGPGDRVIVVDEALREFFYEVAWSRWVAAEGAPVEEIFGGSERSELTLITCGGDFDYAARQYLDRLIVRAIKV